MRTGPNPAFAEDIEHLSRAVERAGWALGCIDVEEHEGWLRGGFAREEGAVSRMSRAMRGLFSHSALIAVFVLL